MKTPSNTITILTLAGAALLFTLTTGCAEMEGDGVDPRSDADDGASSVERTGAVAAVVAGVAAEVQAAVDMADPDFSFPDGSCITSEETSNTVTTYTLTDCAGAFGNATASGTITTEIIVDMLPVLEFEIASQNLTINSEATALDATVTYDTASSEVDVVSAGTGPRSMGSTTMSFTVGGDGCATISGAYQTSSREGGAADVTLTDVQVCEGDCLPASGSASVALSGGRLTEDTDVSLSFTGMNTADWVVGEESGELTAACMAPGS